ncbi:hypothetical protein ANN_06212 [Periplaneta americana]|uniref:small monomeric GTPase n=1 Tax=Periplaneta americana TaxID=6978 RepID=A0ABQ8TFE4_PERAM|nr:hypothetical protein ANN_06212 [Periplaneta americana]
MFLIMSVPNIFLRTLFSNTLNLFLSQSQSPSFTTRSKLYRSTIAPDIFLERLHLSPTFETSVNFLSIYWLDRKIPWLLVTVIMCVFQATGCLYDHIRWGEAFVVVYSVCDRNSFNDAHDLLDKLGKLKLPSYFTTLLLGNKRDLDHSR